MSLNSFAIGVLRSEEEKVRHLINTFIEKSELIER